MRFYEIPEGKLLNRKYTATELGRSLQEKRKEQIMSVAVYLLMDVQYKINHLSSSIS